MCEKKNLTTTRNSSTSSCLQSHTEQFIAGGCAGVGVLSVQQSMKRLVIWLLQATRVRNMFMIHNHHVRVSLEHRMDTEIQFFSKLLWKVVLVCSTNRMEKVRAVSNRIKPISQQWLKLTLGFEDRLRCVVTCMSSLNVLKRIIPNIFATYKITWKNQFPPIVRVYNPVIIGSHVVPLCYFLVVTLVSILVQACSTEDDLLMHNTSTISYSNSYNFQEVPPPHRPARFTRQSHPQLSLRPRHPPTLDIHHRR